MKTVLTLILLAVISCINAQQSSDIIIKKKANDKIVDIDTLNGIRNKTLRCEYDTLYIINKYGVNAFSKCISDLRRVKNLSTSLDTLSQNIEGIHSNVNSIYSNMNELTGFITDYNRKTKIKLDTLEASNKKLLDNLEKVNKSLADARKKISDEQWKKLSINLLWGGGGIVVGGLLFSSLLLLK